MVARSQDPQALAGDGESAPFRAPGAAATPD